MAEYNFWDDRTTEDNDEHYCPIIDGHCYDGKNHLGKILMQIRNELQEERKNA